MESLFSAERWLAMWNTAVDWLLANVFVVDTATQLGVVAFAFVMAALSARSGRRILDRFKDHAVVGRGAQLLASLLLPVLWLLLLWLGLATAIALEQPNGILGTVTTLVAAWIAIYLASQVVKNPAWAKLFAWVAWSIAALSIVGLLDPAVALLDSASIEIAGVEISVYDVIESTLVLAALLTLAVYSTGLVESRIRTSTALSPTVQVLFTKSLKIVLISIAILLAINSLGINLTALAVVGGAIGLGIGFGFQKTISNLISGVILLIDKSIKPGDIISVSGTYGWVTTLGGRYVSVVTRDGVEHLIPNETLISERVENWTHTHSRTRLKIDLGVHFDSDLRRAIGLCEEAARETERVLADPEPKCLFIEFGDSALKLQLRFWIADAQNGVQNVKSAVLLRIWEKFKEHSVEVPYPQRDVHVRSAGPAPSPLQAPERLAPRVA